MEGSSHFLNQPACLACGNKTLAPPCYPYFNCDRRTTAKAVLPRMGDEGWRIAEERRVALMSGRRELKRFLVLTDRRMVLYTKRN